MRYTLENCWEIDGNYWSKELYKTELQAKVAAKTLINCSGCMDCIDCVNCHNCILCEKCAHCIDCISCTNCTECKGSIRYTDCDQDFNYRKYPTFEELRNDIKNKENK